MHLEIKEVISRTATVTVREIEEVLRQQLINTGKLSHQDEVKFIWSLNGDYELHSKPGDALVVKWNHTNGKKPETKQPKEIIVLTEGST